MQWKDHIHSDPKILAGKAVVKGTRLSVDFILGLLRKGWTDAQILENYPQPTKESLLYLKAKTNFETLNRLAAKTPLAQMTQEEIDEEIGKYRRGK